MDNTVDGVKQKQDTIRGEEEKKDTVVNSILAEADNKVQQRAVEEEVNKYCQSSLAVSMKSRETEEPINRADLL